MVTYHILGQEKNGLVSNNAVTGITYHKSKRNQKHTGDNKL